MRDANGDRVAFSDNWSEDANRATAITATGLAPTDMKESAVALTLPAADYTVIVVGRNGSTGVGLIEVYNLR